MSDPLEKFIRILSQIGGALSLGSGMGPRLIPVQQNPQPSVDTQEMLKINAAEKRARRWFASPALLNDRLRPTYHRPEWREPAPSGEGPLFRRAERRRQKLGMISRVFRPKQVP